MNPLVSIIVPAYNHERYITECVENIFNQDYDNYEVIIVDDGSSDDTPGILAELKKKYNFQFFIQENIGVSATLNKYIREVASGKYVSLCASDDFWLSNKITIQVDYMETHPEMAMCFGKTHYVNTASQVLTDAKYYINDKKLKGGFIFKEILTQEFHPPVNYMYRRDALLEEGLFKTNITAEDFYMNCKLSFKYPVGFISEFLGYYRIENLQKKRDPYLLFKDHKKTIDFFKETEFYNEAINKWHLRMFVNLSLYSKYKVISIYHMFKSIKYIFSYSYLLGIFHLLLKWD